MKNSKWIKTIKLMIFNYSNKRKAIHIALDSIVDKSNIFECNNTVGSNTYMSKSVMGRGSYVGRCCWIDMTKIGRFCSIGNHVRIVIGNHPTREYVSTYPAFLRDEFNGYAFGINSDFNEFSYTNKKLKICCEIGNDVWVGDSVSIINGVKIGDGAIIATGAVVVKDVPPYAIVGGVPAKIIKYRFDEDQIRQLLEIKWWDKDINWIKKNAFCFSNIDNFIDMVNKDD